MINFESILDIPQNTLDKSVWITDVNGTFSLTSEAKNKIFNIIEQVQKTFSLENVSARITGSITSNQYTEDSDIDLHISFDGLTDENSEDLNKILRNEFNILKEKNPEQFFINEHPIEVYFQSNPYQDLMSVGCYDVIQNLWLVGPELKTKNFDPYSEYYSENMKYVKDIIGDIRNIILNCYETATVILNSSNSNFQKSEFQNLVQYLDKSVKIFNSAKQYRKIYSSPKSVEDALKKRESKKWKIADSSFKLLDKFGYLKILKKFSKIYENIKDYDMKTTANYVVNSIKNNTSINENIDESISSVKKYLAIAALLAIPSFLPQDALAQNLSRVKPSQFYAYTADVQKAIDEAALDKKLYGGYTASNVINMITRTLYVEGHAEGTEGRKAILSVILNRCGNDKNYIAAVIKEPSAFSCWGKMTDEDWNKFKYKIPTTGTLEIVKNKNNRKIWHECSKLAVQLFQGKFKSTIGNRNSYLNPKTASEKARNSWGKDMKSQLSIGKHKFGYLREHDPTYVYPGTMTPRKK